MKPCPFCGEQEFEEYRFSSEEDFFRDDYSVRCQYCGALGPPASTWYVAVEEWEEREPSTDCPACNRWRNEYGGANFCASCGKDLREDK